MKDCKLVDDLQRHFMERYIFFILFLSSFVFRMVHATFKKEVNELKEKNIRMHDAYDPLGKTGSVLIPKYRRGSPL